MANLSLSSRSYDTLSHHTLRPAVLLEQDRTLDRPPTATWITSSTVEDSRNDTVKAQFAQHPLADRTSAQNSSSPYTVILREAPKNDTSRRRAVELWQGERRVASADVTDAHGAFFNDGMWWQTPTLEKQKDLTLNLYDDKSTLNSASKRSTDPSHCSTIGSCIPQNVRSQSVK